MAEPIRNITVEHAPMVHAIEMRPEVNPLPLTLLELISAVDEVSESENESVATVVYMLKSGRVRLSGNFRDIAVENFID